MKDIDLTSCRSREMFEDTSFGTMFQLLSDLDQIRRSHTMTFDAYATYHIVRALASGPPMYRLQQVIRHFKDEFGEDSATDKLMGAIGQMFMPDVNVQKGQLCSFRLMLQSVPELLSPYKTFSETILRCNFYVQIVDDALQHIDEFIDIMKPRL